MPLQVAQSLRERDVSAEGRQRPVEPGLVAPLGFDTVNAGPLSESWRLERDRPAYVVRQTAAELRENLAKANRLP